MPQPAWVTGRLAPEPALSRFVYNTIFKRSSTYMTAVMIVATATGEERVPDWRRRTAGLQRSPGAAARSRGAG